MPQNSTGGFPEVGQSAPLVPARVDEPELLDLGLGEEWEMRRSFDDLWRVNRFLGGLRSITRYLFPRLRAANVPLTCVDVGTGSGQLAAALASWAREHERDVRVVGLDLSRRHLAVAVERIGASGVALLQADAIALPFGPASVDYIVSSLFLHHLAPHQVVDFLRAAFHAARRSLILSDLIRGWLPLVGFKLIQPVFARSRLTRRDGAISILRAYTPDEMRRLAGAAGIPNAQVHVQFPWRMTLVADK